ncbi:MAG: Smr/MutS family protein [Desulfovibrio sp.]|jgi:DNA mismatch repair protein MutS2|nr:Smr/MutS family protein [Desulfovibrio sp.]
MYAHTLYALELPKVLEYLAAFAVSESGRKACLEMRPLDDLEDVRRKTDFFLQGCLWDQRSDLPLTPFASLDGLFRIAHLPPAVLALEELWEVRHAILQAVSLRGDMLAGGPDSAWPLWRELCLSLPLPEQSLSALNRCLSDDGLLRDEASPELFRIRDELRRLHRQCIRKVKDFAVQYNILQYLQDTFMALSSDRYVLPLKVNFKGRLQGVIHDYSQTGETCYFEPLFLVEINNRLQELKQEEREEERKVLSFLTGLARRELPGIRACRDFLLEVDLLKARHALAGCYDGRMVPPDADSGFLLRGARHPLLALAGSPSAARTLAALRISGESGGEEEKIISLPPAKVVPTTLELLAGQQALVISGGNAGGKTVALKTLGLIALMSRCVLPVPVESGSRLPSWLRIHAFIGDEQSLDDHLSTFTAQISHLARIWPDLCAHTLILLDEFGAGTDPAQGAALAQAVLDAAIERGAFVCSATHFPELKAYALSTPAVRAASVLFDPASRRPLFLLAYDQVGASRALDVAREHGLPEEILVRAGHYLPLGGEDTAGLMDRLNRLCVAREEELAALDRERRSLEETRKNLLDRLDKDRQRLFASIQSDARRILDDWKASRLSHKQALRDLARLRAPIAAPLQEDTAPPARGLADLAAVHIRQRLLHVPWKRIGSVLEVDTRKNRVRLDLEGVSLWADAADLAPAEAPPAHAGGWVGEPGSATVNLPLHLDLRGLRADVAVRELEKFLDGAVLHSRYQVEVVHGRGTGALRRELHAFLRTFPAVARYRLAPEDRGGDGMTIVELK